MHTIQNKDDTILVIYNLSNAISCLKCGVKLMYFFYKIVLMYLKNLTF